MSIYEQFETNKEKEIGGVAVEYGANKDGSIPTFYVTRMSRSNKKYIKNLEKATRPHRRAIELETMQPDQAEKISMGVFVETVLLGWKNVQNRKGEVVTFTKEAATKLFNELPDFYDDLQSKASKASLFRDEALEEEAKN
jgi:hypothetical protein